MLLLVSAISGHESDIPPRYNPFAMNPSTLFATVFVDELTRLPLSGVVVCPGSRSTPLTVAFHRQTTLPVYVHLDERSAAFFALGLALETGQPAVVVTTSGTAAANLHPAVMEADRAGVPLLLLTADRPPELRESGANQTTDQVKLFGRAVRWYLELPLPEQDPPARVLRHLRAVADRAVAAAQGLHGKPGPVHLNFPFRKPLEPDREERNGSSQLAIRNTAKKSTSPLTTVIRAPNRLDKQEINALAELVRSHPRGLIVAGPGAAPDAATAALLHSLSQVTGYPLLANALSGVRFTPSPLPPLVLATYPHFLAAGLPAAAAPDLVLRFGAAPTANPLLHYLENLPPKTETIAFSPAPSWPDPGFRLTQWLVADVQDTLTALTDALVHQPPQPSSAWQNAWAQAERATRELMQEAPLTEGPLVAAVATALPAHARLVVGNSLPVRHLDEYAPPTSQPLRVFANRGVSGIDGVVSTAAGVAAASGQPTVLVIGDLSLLHDIGGLLAVSRFNLQNFHIVVLNNNGGGIFARLPIAQHEPPFTTMFRMPHGLNFAPAAEMYGLRYQRVTPQELVTTLASALAKATPHLIEVPTDAQEHEAERQKLIARLTRLKIG